MTNHSNLTKAAVGASACIAALLAATGGAQAQAYGGAYAQPGYAYDPCARDTTTRGTTGGLTGAALGAAVGGSAAGHGAKTEGAVLGGIIGAIAGSQIGKNTAACTPGAYGQAAPAYAPAPPPPPPPPSAYYQQPQAGAYAQGGAYYDPCTRSTNQRGTTGGLVGAGIGGLAGANVAARKNRTEGAVIGAIAGAVIGNKVGNASAACAPGQVVDPQYGYQNYESQPYAQGGQSYGYETYERYDSRYPDPRSQQGYGGGYAAPVADSRTDVNGCTLAESPIYLPDGRTQKRFVRVCPDANGRYQVVD